MTHEELANAYAIRLVDDMDMASIVQITIEHIEQSFLEYEPDQLRTLIKDDGLYGDILEEVQ